MRMFPPEKKRDVPLIRFDGFFASRLVCVKGFLQCKNVFFLVCKLTRPPFVCLYI